MSVTPITSKSSARRDAEMLEVALYIEAERQRIGDEQMLDMLNADGLLPLKGVERLRHCRFAGRPQLRVVAANRTPTTLPLMTPFYGLLRRQIHVVK